MSIQQTERDALARELEDHCEFLLTTDDWNSIADFILVREREHKLIESGFAQDRVKIARLEQQLATAREALDKIAKYPVHSEPVGGAYGMQDIADKALLATQPEQKGGDK